MLSQKISKRSTKGFQEPVIEQDRENSENKVDSLSRCNVVHKNMEKESLNKRFSGNKKQKRKISRQNDIIEDVQKRKEIYLQGNQNAKGVIEFPEKELIGMKKNHPELFLQSAIRNNTDKQNSFPDVSEVELSELEVERLLNWTVNLN